MPAASPSCSQRSRCLATKTALITNPRPSQPDYWDVPALKTELGRVLDICHGCRRCWNLCPSFGNIFKRIDALDDQLNGHAPDAAALAQARDPVQALSRADHRKLVDECYQCKLCYNHCPYHPPHRYVLDFPRLMQRAKAVRVKAEGIARTDRLFSRADLVGRLGSAFAGLANWSARRPWPRLLMEKTLGIHRNRRLPLFASQTFRKWWDWRGPKAREAGEAALIYTCTVNYNEPATGKAAIAALEKNGLQAICPKQDCCGMPFLDAGDIAGAAAAARRMVRRLLPLALRRVPIVVLGPTCSFMMREEYPALLENEDARRVAAMVKDIGEFMMDLARTGKLNQDFQPVGENIVYQPPCHLKAQNFGLKSRDMLARLPGAKVTVADHCSTHDGTWSMKTPYFDMSMGLARKLFEEIEQAKPDAVATDCPLAAVQIEQGTGRRARHPIVFLARAYGYDPDQA